MKKTKKKSLFVNCFQNHLWHNEGAGLCLQGARFTSDHTRALEDFIKIPLPRAPCSVPSFPKFHYEFSKASQTLFLSQELTKQAGSGEYEVILVTNTGVFLGFFLSYPDFFPFLSTEDVLGWHWAHQQWALGACTS